ncbi:linear amide C-N hydrolase [Puteibacter caeruleilacunae]|nr:linear amide C-N hydrolase [Puteibacter caeruleilacunae]
MKLKVVVIILVLFGFYGVALGCSAFTIKGRTDVFMYKSYDWHFGNGVLMYNPKAVAKISFPAPGAYQKLRWRSKYASLTFNQYGQSLPNGGMNEAGLAIEILWLNCSVYPKLKGQKALIELQWIQYGLDNFKSVDELIQQTSNIVIAPLYAKVHYFITDRMGNSAVVEYIDGKRIVHRGKGLPYAAITNSTYGYSKRGFETDAAGCGRFNSICKSLNVFSRVDKSQTLMSGFNVLDKVKTRGTKWQIGYDLGRREVCFRTCESMEVKKIRMSDFDCENKVACYIELNTSADLHVSDFKKVSVGTNDRLLKEAFKQLRLPVPFFVRWLFAYYLTNEKDGVTLKWVMRFWGIFK